MELMAFVLAARPPTASGEAGFVGAQSSVLSGPPCIARDAGCFDVECPVVEYARFRDAQRIQGNARLVSLCRLSLEQLN